MKILFADLVESPDYAALQDRPEAFDGLRMDRAVNVLMRAMVNSLMRITVFSEPPISGPLIGAKQADFVRDGFVDKIGQGLRIDVLNNASNDVSLAAHCADNDCLALSLIALPATFIPMPIAAVAANDCFVNLDDPGELLHVLNESDPDLVAHEPSRLVRAEAHIAVDLKGAHSLFADQHQMRDSEPVFQRLIRVLKDCAGQVREAVALFCASVALPVEFHCPDRIHALRAAPRATDAIGPAANDQVSDTIVLGLKERIELLGGQLVNGLRSFFAGHNGVLFERERTLT